MRIGDFTVFLISMKFFFSFQLAVYKLSPIITLAKINLIQGGRSKDTNSNKGI